MEEVKRKVDLALSLLEEKDAFLLETGVNERSIAHKLAEYLQVIFSEWNVDCEYNKKGLDIKTLDGIRACNLQKKTDRVYPDIIIHKRNKKENYIVIEIKTVRNEEACDVEKLKLFTSRGDYEYMFGLYLEFTGLRNNQKWFINGQLQTHLSLLI